MVKIPRSISIVVVISAILFFWGWFSSDLVLSVERMNVETTPGDYGIACEQVAFTTTDGIEIHGWFMPGEGPASIIILHGWGANKGDILPRVRFLHQRGAYNLLLIDLRNHGESGGKKTSLGCFEQRDLDAALDYLKKNKPASSRRIGVLGASLGGAAGILGAARRKEIGALVVESAFCSPDDVVARYAKLFFGIPRVPLVSATLFCAQAKLGVRFSAYRAVDHISRIAPRPVLIIQGGADRRMPVWEGEALYTAAGEPKQIWTVPGADHDTVYLKAPAEYEKRVLAFFGKYLGE